MINKLYFAVITLIVTGTLLLVTAQQRDLSIIRRTGEIYKNRVTQIQNRPFDFEVFAGVTADSLWSSFYNKDTLPDGVTNLAVSVSGAPAVFGMLSKIQYDSGVFIDSVWSNGTISPWGTYKDMPPLNNIKLHDGILLTTGSVFNATGPNTGTWSTYSHSLGKKVNPYTDPELEALSGMTGGEKQITNDAMDFMITFTTDTTVKGFAFDFAFGSDEYPEYVDQEYNDIVAVFLDGENVLKDNKGELISINSAFFEVDNQDGKVNLEYDGFTLPLRLSDSLAPGTHTLRFAICDISDADLESGIFLSNFSFDYEEGGLQAIKIYDQTMYIKTGSVSGTIVDDIILGDTTNLSLTLLNQDPLDHFVLDGKTVKVAEDDTIDVDEIGGYNNDNSYYLYVIADNGDGFPDTAKITIIVLDNNIDANIIDDQSFTISETADAGDIVGKIQKAIDSSGITLKLLSISPLDHFKLSSDSLKVKNDVKLDYEANKTYTLKVVASLFNHHPDTASITINISDFNLENLINDQIMNVNENVSIGTMVGNIVFAVDTSVSVTLKTVSYDPQEILIISGIAVTTAGIVDFESNDTIKITVIAEADEAAPDTALIIVIVNDLFELMNVDSAVVYDNNGNGVGDSLIIFLDEELLDVHPTSGKIVWPMEAAETKFTWGVNTTNYGSLITINYNSGQDVITAGTGTVDLFFDELPGGSISGTIKDGIGPILIDTVYAVERFFDGEDTLTISFSEEIDSLSLPGMNFNLLTEAGKKTITINDVISCSGNIYSVTAHCDGEIPATGDSLSILSSGTIIDRYKNKAHENNPFVPIITLRRPVPVTSSWYEDGNGDGTIDTVHFLFAKKITEPSNLKASIIWSIDNNASNFIGLSVYNGDSTHLIADFSTSFDNVIDDKTSGKMTAHVVDEGILSENFISVTPMDKAAPVIVSAKYLPGGAYSETAFDKDTLSIEFSETMDLIFTQQPFQIKDKNGELYSLSLTAINQGNNAATFLVETILNNTPPSNGDSIHISIEGEVYDVEGNLQKIKENQYVPMEVFPRPFNLLVKTITIVDSDNLLNSTEVFDGESFSIQKGIPIIIKTPLPVEKELLEKCQYSLTIFDYVGNVIAKTSNNNSSINFESSMASLNGVPVIGAFWSGKNSNGRDIGNGTYLLIAETQIPDNNLVRQTLIIGVK